MKRISYSPSYTISFRNEPLILLPPRQCLSLHQFCPNITNVTAIQDVQNSSWMEVTNYICYILLPVTLFFCILGQIVNIIILSRQIRLSLDTYLLVLSLMSLLQCAVAIVLCLPNYIGHSDLLVHIRYYCYICHEWFRYTGIWVLVSATLERSVTLTVLHSHNYGTSNQACIITSIVTCVGLLSSLPWLWEYEISNFTTRTEDPTTNHTVSVIVHKSQHSYFPNYHYIYFWYIFSTFVILPMLLMLISYVILSKNTKSLNLNDFNQKYHTNTAIILNRRQREDAALTKLVMNMVIFYLILTTPSVLSHLLSKLMPSIVNLNDVFVITILNVFTVLYFMYFVIHQQLYFCYNKQYRLTLLSICCCCC